MLKSLAFQFHAMQIYSRPLDTNKLVENFLNFSLQLDYTTDPKLKKIITQIVDGELGISKSATSTSTLSYEDMRDPKYRSEQSRWQLRQKIIDQLFTQTRLDNDEKISFKRGGALPQSGVKFQKQAYIIIGLPASGKSRIASDISESEGAIIIDSDFAKRKLPEFNNHLYGAAIVHEESSQIVNGFTNNPNNIKSLLEICIEKDSNIIIPKIGNNPESIIKLTKALKDKKGYETHLILVSLPKKEATIRAIYRYASSKRYVPLGLIFDGYGNDPSLCYYYLRCKYENLFSSFGVVSTNAAPVYNDLKGNSPVNKYPFKDSILQLP